MAVTRDANGNLVYTTQNDQPIPGDVVLPPIGPIDMAMPQAMQDSPVMQSSDGQTVQQLEDGSVVISIESGDDGEPSGSSSFDDNLAETMDQMLMASLCADVLEGIDADIESRRQLIETYTRSLDLFGP